MKKTLALLVVSLVAVACQTGRQVEVRPVDDAPSTGTLDASASVYIAWPNVSAAQGDSASEASERTLRVLASELGGRVGTVTTGTAPEDAEQARTSARAANATCAIVPQVILWVDHRDTWWTSRGDHAHVRLWVLDTETGEQIDVHDLKCTSDLWLGRGDPDDLLERAAREYVAMLVP